MDEEAPKLREAIRVEGRAESTHPRFKHSVRALNPASPAFRKDIQSREAVPSR